MRETDRNALFQIVRGAVVNFGKKKTVQIIEACHMHGKLGGFIDNDNLHLFRQYRNMISADPNHLTYKATGGIKL
jgi:hypothetical protein